MTYLIKILLISFLLSTPALAADKNTVTNKILALTGMKSHAHEIANFAINEIENRKAGLPEDEFKRLNTIIRQAFNEENIYSIIAAHFKHHYDAKHSPQWLSALKTTEMVEISALEHEGAKPSNFKNVIAYAQQLQSSPPAKTRLDLIKRLNDATRASDLAIESQISVTKILLHAINPYLTSNKQMSTSQLKSALDALRMQMTQNLEQFTTITYLYTYRTLSDEALKQYVTQYESPAGQWISNTTYNAVMEALTDANQP